MSNVDPSVAAIIQLASQLGVAAIFILAWWQERKERQQLTASMNDMQTAHRLEMLKIIEQMFTVMSGLHLGGQVTVPPDTIVSKN